MRVSKWGNSLAVRLPSSLADALRLKEGDEVEIMVTRKPEAIRDSDRKKAVARIKALSKPLPKGFRVGRNAS